MLTAVLPALVASALLVGFAVWIYLRRELPIAGRGRLAALRAALLVLLVLLLVDPVLPARGGAGGGHWVILDASRSMSAGGPGETPWDRALARARVLASEGATLLVLGDPPVAVPAVAGLDSLAAREPDGEPSRVTAALRRAAEAGAGRITLLSDLRLDDALAAEAEGARLGLAVEVADVGDTVRSAGIARLDAPATGRADQEVEVAVEVFATAGAAGDSATLTLFRDDEEVASWPLALPDVGAMARRTFETTLPDASGPVHWRAQVALAGDAFPDDDARSRITEVDPASGIVALVALAPDWEPRFLLPVLAGVTGLPARGWLQVGPDAFLPMEGGAPVGAAELRPVLEDARVVVLQGRGRGAPAWVAEVGATARRVVTLAADEVGAAAAGVAASPARAGEWYVAEPLPPSPLAGALAGVAPARLPPLGRVLVASEAGGGPPAQPTLMLQAPGGGGTAPALVLLDGAERREAVVLASGLWRWAFRPGEPREAYRRLWSGVAGWLLELDEGRSLAGLAPEATVVSTRREAVWRAPGAAGGQVEIVLTRRDSVLRTDTLAVGADGEMRQPAPPPGRLAWRARVLAPDSVARRDRVWTGTLEAEPWTGELLPPRAELAFDGDAVGGRRAGRSSGVPLRTRPWPYLLALALLSLEWFGRRRRGLR